MSGHFHRELVGRRPLMFAMGLFCLTFAASCGGPKAIPIKGQLPVFPVSGKLTMNGEPMADAQICFYTSEEVPKGTSKIRPHATTEEDGSFRVSTYASEDGAPVGKYSVTISWKGPAVGAAGDVGVAGDDDDRPEKVAPAYRNPRITKLKAEITEGENTLAAWDLPSENQQPLQQQQTSNTPN